MIVIIYKRGKKPRHRNSKLLVKDLRKLKRQNENNIWNLLLQVTDKLMQLSHDIKKIIHVN